MLANAEKSYHELRINPSRLEQRIQALAEFGKTPEGGVNRVAYSDADIQARNYLKQLMQAAGLKVKVDAAGNIIGRRKGREAQLPPILFGSHSDTVPHGGKYDGALGVLSAVECIEVLKEHAIVTRHPLEVIVFTDEEGGLIGSRALAGDITPDVLDNITHSSKTVRRGLRDIGGDPDNLASAARKKGDIRAFVEIHIEQGAILESLNLDIGIVEGIVGIKWWDVTIQGFANHAGTTPMDMRQDALLAAAQFILAVNRIVKSEPGSQVGTVGRIKAEPGAPNVIPGKVTLSLELRDLSSEKIDALFLRIEQETKNIENQTGVKISISPVDAFAVPAPTDLNMRRYIAEAAQALGLKSQNMPSGAGHDAQEIAQIAPIGMIFVPSIGGISHSPREFTRVKDMANGANVLLHTVLKIDQDSLSK